MRKPVTSYQGLLIVVTVLSAILNATCLFGDDDNTKGNNSAQTSTVKTASADMPMIPEPDPPKIDIEAEALAPQRSMVVKGAATVEWTYHKTSDNAHPDGNEQQLLWLMNQANRTRLPKGSGWPP